MGIPDFSHLPVTIRRLKLGKRQSIEIHRDLVRVTEKGLFATKWNEPVSAFKGVLLRQIVGGGGQYAHVAHLVELVHPDKDKTLRLYKSLRVEEVRKLREDAACALDLPLLDETVDGFVARAPEDLHKSVRDLAAAEKILVDFDADAPPARGVMWKHLEGELHVTLTVLANSYGTHIANALKFVVGALLFRLGLLFSDIEGDYLWVGLLLFGVMLMGGGGGRLLLDGIAKRRIVITPTELRYFRETPFGTFRHKAIPLNELESVRRIPKKGLLIESGTTSLSIGERLGEEQLLWFERFILAATINPPS
ncbi:MAG: hypothetical protein ACFFCW_34910 [Candidatus Hodarchaeota archaeon]